MRAVVVWRRRADAESRGARAAALTEQTDDALAALIPRIGALHLRQRLGMEHDHEARRLRLVADLVPRQDMADSIARLIRLGLHVSGLRGRGSRNARRMTVRHNIVRLAHLPPQFDSYTMLHLSDLHIDGGAGFTAAIIAAVRDLKFDICVLTGDYRAHTYGPFDATLRELASLRPHLGETVYATLGNHDTIRLVPPMEALGYRFLLNETVRIVRDGASIMLSGVEDAHYYRLENFHRVADTLPEGEVAILLSHAPEAYRHAALAGYDLMLSGHTHGGQICLPGGRPVLTAGSPRHIVRGVWRHRGMAGFTTTGCGTSVIDVRLNCPPEVVLHELRRS